VVLAKNGLSGDFPALSANVIRMTAAFAALWGVTILQRQVSMTVQQVKQGKSGMLYILGGAFFGPLIGVSLSLFAIQNTNVGIASTIIALPPIFLLPVGRFVFKEKITWQAVGGTLLAIGELSCCSGYRHIISLSMEENTYLYRSLYRIRRFEETVLENFPRNIFYGTTHTYLGQEADAVGVLSTIQSEDIVFSNHRCHGHFLAYGGDAHALFAELMGRNTGVCGGRGGSQHIHWRNFYSNGVQGGTIPIATGMALAEKYKNTGVISVAFLGDGTLGEGVIYEAFNMASLWNAPILYVLENNRIAQTTPIEIAVAGDIAGRFQAFGIPTQTLDTSDVLEIIPTARDLVSKVRLESSPQALVLNTYRFGPHSKGDDTRAPEAIQKIRLERDPIQIQGERLNQGARKQIEQAVDEEIRSAFNEASRDPFPVEILD
jgi:TPP-dependent pyruvate/acetoin dehydrogenase alpha subunit